MPRKANAQRAKARELYEQDGLSLAEIAQQLNIKDSTIRSWKAKDKKSGNEWSDLERSKTKKERGVPKRGKDKKKRSMNPNSLKNLDPIREHEQRALKHGLYAKQLHGAAKEIYESIDEDYIKNLKDSLKIGFANYIGGQKYLDFSDPTHWSANSRALQALASVATQLDTMLDKRAEDVEDDGLIDALKNAGDVWDDEDD